MENKRFKPTCLLLIDGLHIDFLSDQDNLDLNIAKLKDTFPLLLLKSNDRNIEIPYNAYTEIGTGISEIDAIKKTTPTSLSRVISFAGLKQLHISTTENYSNMTYFFNGRNKERHNREDWFLISSEKTDNYINKLDSISVKITSKIIKEIENQNYDFMVFNYPNLLTEEIDKSKALKIIDKNLEKIIDHILAYNGALIISSPTSFIKNNNIVPIFFISKEWKDKSHIFYDYSKRVNEQIPSAYIYDIAPTIIKIMGISKPQQMPGTALI